MNTEQEKQLATLNAFLEADKVISVLEGDRYTSATIWFTGILESIDMKEKNLNLLISRDRGYVQRTNINQAEWKPGTVVYKRTIPFEDIRTWNYGEPVREQ